MEDIKKESCKSFKRKLKRYLIEFDKSNIPYNNITDMVNGWFYGAILKDFPKYHDSVSCYSHSQLHGGEQKGDTISFPYGGTLMISCIEEEFSKDLLDGLFKYVYQSSIGDMKVIKIADITDYYKLNGNEKYIDVICDPILLKEDKKYLFLGDKRIKKNENDILTYKEKLLEQLKRKTSFCNTQEDIDSLNIDILDFDNAKFVKLYNHRNENNPFVLPATNAKIRLYGNKEILENLVFMGLGNSTGAGFGFVTFDFKDFNFKNFTLC